MDMFPSVSRWVNPTDKIVKLDICVKANCEAGDGRMKIELYPRGAELPYEQRKKNIHETDRNGLVICARLPSELDAAIHIIRDGVIVGGLAPQLRKLDLEPEEEPTLAPELDPLDSAKRENFEKATIALAQKEAAERTLITSGAALVEVNRQQQAQADAAAAAELNRALAETQKAEADKMRAEAEQLLADARAQKAEAEKATKAAAKVKAEAEKSKAEADAAMAQATEPKTPEVSGASGDTAKSGKAGGKPSQ